MAIGAANRHFNFGFNIEGRKHVTLGFNATQFYNAYGSWGWSGNANADEE